jgi:hypothetical protein
MLEAIGMLFGVLAVLTFVTAKWLEITHDTSREKPYSRSPRK